MKFLETILAKWAFISAYTAAGSASFWSAYQPKEPDMKKLSK